MSVTQTTAYCATCQRQSLFQKQRINHVLHLILSIVTVGIWGLLVWLPLGIISASRKPRCATCGMAVGQKPVGGRPNAAPVMVPGTTEAPDH